MYKPPALRALKTTPVIEAFPICTVFDEAGFRAIILKIQLKIIQQPFC